MVKPSFAVFENEETQFLSRFISGNVDLQIPVDTNETKCIKIISNR
jgi:hypothetical protein